MVRTLTSDTQPASRSHPQCTLRVVALGLSVLILTTLVRYPEILTDPVDKVYSSGVNYQGGRGRRQCSPRLHCSLVESARTDETANVHDPVGADDRVTAPTRDSPFKESSTQDMTSYVAASPWENSSDDNSNMTHVTDIHDSFGNGNAIGTNTIEQDSISNRDDQTSEKHMSANKSEIRYVEGKPYVISKSTKTLLQWSNSFGKRIWWGMKYFGQDVFSDCEVNSCFLTNNRSDVIHSDFVMFHYRDSPNWPEIRYQNQSYVHFLVERPLPQEDWLHSYDNHINLTFNYRHDADISYWPYIFPVHETIIPGPYEIRIPLIHKPFYAVWPVSHCPTASKREEYVRELSKYIDVHIYGRCGNYSCPKQPFKYCFKMFEASYKFYISFENSICEDYITEKLQVPMQYELIPVVLGGGDYKKSVPPKSYIDVRDFKSPKDLADYLHRLAVNETEYVEYFQWKQTYGAKARHDAICLLCAAAHNESLARPAHDSYHSWWHDACDNDLVPRMRREGGW